jgi:hypothetical protein
MCVDSHTLLGGWPNESSYQILHPIGPTDSGKQLVIQQYARDIIIDGAELRRIEELRDLALSAPALDTKESIVSSSSLIENLLCQLDDAETSLGYTL